MRLKPLTRLDAGSALRWELARTDTFSEPTPLPGREKGHGATNQAWSGDIRPQTLRGDCKEIPREFLGGIGIPSPASRERAGQYCLLQADKERTCSPSL